jgi:hypothetical protein
MLVSTPKISAVLLAIAAVGNSAVIANKPLAKTPLSGHINTTGIHNIVERDQARARMILARASGNIPEKANEPLSNELVVYVATIGVGSPPTFCKSRQAFQARLQLSSQMISRSTLEGDCHLMCFLIFINPAILYSSNTWLGAQKKYVKTSSSKKTPDDVVG